MTLKLYCSPGMISKILSIILTTVELRYASKVGFSFKLIFLLDFIFSQQESVDLVPASDDYDSSGFIVDTKPQSWFLQNGSRVPDPPSILNGKRNAKLLPFEDPGNDRIINQMMFVPPNYNSSREPQNSKTILLFNGIAIWWPNPPYPLKDLKCPVHTCRLTIDRAERNTADLVLFWSSEASNEPRPLNQIYAYYDIEPPFLTVPLKFAGGFQFKDFILYKIY